MIDAPKIHLPILPEKMHIKIMHRINIIISVFAVHEAKNRIGSMRYGKQMAVAVHNAIVDRNNLLTLIT